MAREGEEIDLLTYGQGSEVQLPSVRVIRTPAMRWLGRIPTGPSWRKVLHDVPIFAYTVWLLLRNRYDYVHCHEESVFMARLLKPLFGFRLLYDMHSSLPEQLSNFSFSESKLLKRMFQRAERSALAAADAVIVVCPTLRKSAEKFVTDPDKVVLIENSQFGDVALKDSAAPEAPNRAIQEARRLAGAGHPIILYAGTLEAYQGIDLLLRGFKLLTANDDSSRLLIVGGEPAQVHDYGNLAGQLGIADRCLFSGKVAQSTAASCNEFASILVSTRTSGTNTPMKIYSQIASGVPLLATRIESHTQVLNDTVATLVEPDPEAVAHGLQQAITNPAVAHDKARKAIELFAEKYSEAMFSAKTRAVIRLLAADHKQLASTSHSAD
jgi:glycosyltransferase involved in cell wall biosynthesis